MPSAPLAQAPAGVPANGCVRSMGVSSMIPASGGAAPKLPLVSVPYGCLVPRSVDGLLVAGRHVSSDPASHSFLREIPQCWLTGQAAGVAAGVAVRQGVVPRVVPVGDVQAELLRQGAWVRVPAPVG